MGSYAISAGTNQRPFIMRVGKNYKSDLIDGGAVYPGDYAGKVYYVNNITGSSTNDGLSWNKAFDQVSTAVTASETQRALYTGTTNDYVRNVIYVQGTGTAYTALSALPSYTDVIGVGAVPYGDGAGIAVIGAAGADGIAGTARGLGLYNLQILSGGAYWCADFVSLFRSEIGFCAFKATDPTLVTVHTDGGIRFTANSGGNYIHDCMWMGANDSWHDIGISITGGTIFNATRIENNMIRAETAGIYIGSAVTNCDVTYVRNNDIGGGQRTLAVGVDDNATVGMAVYTGNRISGTDGGQLVHNGAARWVGNYRANDFSTVTAS